MTLLDPQTPTSHPDCGYLVDYSPGAAAGVHAFCGRPLSKRADCPNCGRPLLRFVGLDVADPRIQLTDRAYPYLELLYCWTCNLAQSAFAYRMLAGPSVEILRFGEGGVTEEFPYRNYPHVFPGAPASLIAVSDVQQRAIQDMNRG